jgi:RNA polymerase sigma factor (sigma-70 family)
MPTHKGGPGPAPGSPAIAEIPGNRSAPARLLGDVDPDLVRRAQRGDTAALAAVLDALLPYVGRICASVALDDGEDAAQESLVLVLRGLPALREPEAVWAWARRIAVREAVRVARRRAGAGHPTDPAVLAAMVAAGAPADGRADATTAVDVRVVLAGLPPEQRAVLVLRHLGDVPEAELSELLAIPPGTVKSRLFRARAALRTRWTA